MEREPLLDQITPVFSTGSTLLNLVIGGGWHLGRMFNIVGDKSTNKTGFAVEGFANFELAYPKGKMRYAESEAAFDENFAQVLGFPERVERPKQPLDTVEDFRDDFYRFLQTLNGEPGLYILDSLDAISDDAEVKKFEKDMKKRMKNLDKISETAETESSPAADEKEKGSFGTGKAKQMSSFFRMLVRESAKANCALGIISQVRDNIGVMFGEQHTRSGGRALDFYASQIVWLAQVQQIKRTFQGIERPIGATILTNCKKCKVGFPFRKAQMDLIFAYGIDDEISMLNWLKTAKIYPEAQYKEVRKMLEDARDKRNFEAMKGIKQKLVNDTTTAWNTIENGLAPKLQKYGQQVPQAVTQ